MPPPTTTRSALTTSSGAADSPRFSARHAAREAASFGGGFVAATDVKYTASQRPSNPVRSLRETVCGPATTRTIPASTHPQSAGAMPSVDGSVVPPTARRKRPGFSPSQSGVQSRVRTHARTSPPKPKSTFVSASATGSPIPCARRYGEPITSTNCGSTTHPPFDANDSASTSASVPLMNGEAASAANHFDAMSRAPVSVG